MSERNEINGYLQTLSRYLVRLPLEDANEVVREIESHIFDAMEQAEAQGQEIKINQLLEGFGTPRNLAEQYTSHMLEGTPPPEGFSAIKAVKHKATKGVYWITLIVGYLIGFSLILLAIAKVILPELVGVWPSAGGQSVIVGIVDIEMQPDNEIMKGWLAPAAAILGTLITRWTYKLSQILKRLIG